MAIIVARIIALTPHSADVERCISANNRLKTDKRSSLSLETENKYLYVHFNMTVLEKFDPHPAINEWFGDLNRRNMASATTSSTKKREQPYFKHIFTSVIDESDNEDENKEEYCMTTKFSF